MIYRSALVDENESWKPLRRAIKAGNSPPKFEYQDNLVLKSHYYEFMEINF